jgi:hypothetical protein
MTNSRLMWVSIESRAGGLYVAKSDSEPRLLVTAPTIDMLKRLVPSAIVDLFQRSYGESVAVYPLDAEDDPRQAVAIVPQERLLAHA